MQGFLIVTFHGIGTPGPGIPDEERHYWAKSSDFEALVPEVITAANMRDLVPLFTLDDGNQSDLSVAAPVLKRHGAKAIFFPCSGRIDQPGYLNNDAIRDLQSEGFEIGSHGVDHLPWATLNRDHLRVEAESSKQVLEDVTGTPIRSAALPFGSYSRRVLSALKRAGYDSVYSSDPGVSRQGRWFNPRFSYRNDKKFDPAALADAALRPTARFVRAGKSAIKALR